jgi:hypothetical protein
MACVQTAVNYGTHCPADESLVSNPATSLRSLLSG